MPRLQITFPEASKPGGMGVIQQFDDTDHLNSWVEDQSKSGTLPNAIIDKNVLYWGEVIKEEGKPDAWDGSPNQVPIVKIPD